MYEICALCWWKWLSRERGLAVYFPVLVRTWLSIVFWMRGHMGLKPAKYFLNEVLLVVSR